MPTTGKVQEEDLVPSSDDGSGAAPPTGALCFFAGIDLIGLFTISGFPYFSVKKPSAYAPSALETAAHRRSTRHPCSPRHLSQAHICEVGRDSGGIASNADGVSLAIEVLLFRLSRGCGCVC